MALIECPECETQVSDKADKCPKCACPIKGRQSGESEGCFLQTLNFGCAFAVAVVVGIVLLVILVGLFG